MLSSRPKALAFLIAQCASVIANANEEPPSFDGDWRGKWADSVGESGDGTFTIKESNNQTLTGIWGGNIRVRGERLGVNVFSFEGRTGNRLYRGIGSLTDDELTINYSVTRNDEGGKYYGWGTLTRNQTVPSEAKVSAKYAASPFDGEWRGKWENSVGESGDDTFAVKEKRDNTLSGLWAGEIPVRGERVGSRAFLFEGSTDRRQYNGVGVLTDKKLVIKYVAKRLDADGKYFGWELLAGPAALTGTFKQFPQVAAVQIEPSGLVIRGQVLNEDGHPLSNMRVEVEYLLTRKVSPTSSTSYAAEPHEILTDKQGRFEVSGRHPNCSAEILIRDVTGEHKITAFVPGDHTAAKRRVVQLKPLVPLKTGALTGQVLVDGKPLAGLRVE